MRMIGIYENYENEEILCNSVKMNEIYESYENGEVLFNFMKMVEIYGNDKKKDRCFTIS